MVTGVDEHGASPPPRTIQTRQSTVTKSAGTVVWAAGVHASPIGKCCRPISPHARSRPDEASSSNRIYHLRGIRRFWLSAISRVFVLKRETGARVSPHGDPAGPLRRAADHGPPGVVKKTGAISLPRQGSVATDRRNRAVAEIGPFQFSGIVAWFAWLFIHLLNIVEFENRVLIALKWAIDYFTYNRGARLITGDRQR